MFCLLLEGSEPINMSSNNFIYSNWLFSFISRNGKCENVVGSFNCICDDGYSVKESLDEGCTDDDECNLNIHHCDPMATCQNTNGSYDCICNEGFVGDGFDCKDVNECLTNNGRCSANARCLNRNGGFQCLCDDGFSGKLYCLFSTAYKQ